MSKHKDIEKIKPEKEHVEKIKPEKEHIEKIKPEKEHFKIEKLEKQEHKEFKEFKEPIKEKVEHKEKPEKLEHKEKPEKLEHKDKNEKIEHKDKIEIKEVAKLEHGEKQVPEKGGKELAEGGHPGDIFTSHGASEPISAEAAATAKQAEKIPEKLQQKEIEKFKREKEHIKTESKDFKFEKIEHKELKHEKLEIKEKPEKIEKPEKFEKEHSKPEKREKEHLKIEIKEFKIEINETVKDFSTEGPGKGLVEGPQGPGDLTTNPFKGTGAPEDRLAELEDAVTRLSHFIGVDLRPDLSAGALNREPDVSSEGEAQPADTGEKPEPEEKPKKR